MNKTIKNLIFLSMLSLFALGPALNAEKVISPIAITLTKQEQKILQEKLILAIINNPQLMYTIAAAITQIQPESITDHDEKPQAGQVINTLTELKANTANPNRFKTMFIKTGNDVVAATKSAGRGIVYTANGIATGATYTGKAIGKVISAIDKTVDTTSRFIESIPEILARKKAFLITTAAVLFGYIYREPLKSISIDGLALGKLAIDHPKYSFGPVIFSILGYLKYQEHLKYYNSTKKSYYENKSATLGTELGKKDANKGFFRRLLPF